MNDPSTTLHPAHPDCDGGTAPASAPWETPPADMGRKAQAAGLAGQAPKTEKVAGYKRRPALPRKVAGYVLRCIKARKAHAVYQARLERLTPLKQKADELAAEAKAYFGGLTGGQIAEAQRILDAITAKKGA